MTTPVPYGQPPISPRSRGVATGLAAALGMFGAHRFYVGRTGSGLLMLGTLGGLGLWWMYDLVVVASGNFTDKRGRRVVNWDVEEPIVDPDLPPHALEEIELLKAQVAELQERMEFAERLLGPPPGDAGRR